MSEQQDTQQHDEQTSVKAESSRFIVLKLSALAVAMFAFAMWVMPPLYILLCEISGLRKVGGAYTPIEDVVDESRWVNVQFVATQNDAMPWTFKAMEHRVKVHPGKSTTIKYFVENTSDRPMIAQAVPSITPYNAVNYFHKVECFCFERQPLEAGETAELGMQFIVDRELPAKVKTITVSYTLFDITDKAESEIAKAD